MLKSDNLNFLSESSVKELIVPLTEYLRKIAFDSGWPAHLIQHLSVDFDSNYTLFVDYPDSAKEEIENLEYGDINGLPNAAIRPFILRAQEVIGSIIERKILPTLLVDMGVF